MRGSSCRYGASLSGFVLVPVSSKSEAVREEMENKSVNVQGRVHFQPIRTCRHKNDSQAESGSLKVLLTTGFFTKNKK